jgi:hypothetical protein
MPASPKCLFVVLDILLLATLNTLNAAEPPLPRSAPSSEDQVPKAACRQNALVIGASSLNSPVPQAQLVEAMLASSGIPMDFDSKFPDLDAVEELLKTKGKWDFVVLDAWHLGRTKADWGKGGAAVPADFPKAMARFVKEVRAHSPECKIILFPWWIPGGPKATKEGAMEVFQSCVEAGKSNRIWVATTGPAFMEALLDRPDLHITKSKTDGHPGKEGAYLNACSLYAIIAGKTPVGLPATLSLAADDGKKEDFTIADTDAKDLQELAWKVYQREIKNTKPSK